MVRTRSRASSEDEFPLFHALIAGNATTIAALCTTKEATKCGPGSLSAVMLTLLLDRDTYLPQLIAAGAPLDVPLTLSSANAEMQQWLAAAQLTDSAVVRQEVRAVLQGNFKRGLCPLGLALSLSKWEQAKLLVAAGADLQPLFQDHDCYDWWDWDTSPVSGSRSRSMPCLTSQGRGGGPLLLRGWGSWRCLPCRKVSRTRAWQRCRQQRTAACG